MTDQASIIIIVQTSCLTFSSLQMAFMDCIKVYDSQILSRKNSSLLDFLEKKQKKSRSLDNVSVYTEQMETNQDNSTLLCPDFSFTFTDYQIGTYVEYNVILNEKYKILGRAVLKKYSFKTRYSMLEILDAKLGEMGLPGKRLFGNKSPSFIQKRKSELESYLNRVAQSRSEEFYKFVKQIKDNEFNASLNQRFSIQ